MQQTLPEKTVDPTKEVKEVWRCQASQNVSEHPVLCAIDELTVNSTVNACTRELVNFEAVKAL